MKNYKMMEWTDENVRKFWNYESNFKENYFTYQVGDKVVKYLNKYLSDKSNILDFGCGAGYLIKHLLVMDMEVFGLDFSDESVKKVNNLYSGEVNFRGAYTLDYICEKKYTFDSIIATEVIEHLDDKKLDGMMNFVKYSLSKDGIAIFTTPNDENLSKSMVYCPESDNIFHRWQHVRSWSEESLKTYLLKYFQHVEIKTTNFSIVTSRKTSLKIFIKKILGKYSEPKQPHMIAIVWN